MKPAWDSLADEFDGSPSVLVADVDCTTEGKGLCSRFGVQGYPTIKSFFADGSDPEDYRGGRDLDSLRSHVDENLRVKCLITNPSDGCTDKEQSYIEKMSKKSKEDIAKQFTRLTNMKGQSMKKELKSWLNQRLSILAQMGIDGEL